MPPSLRAVLFDWDGTLVNSAEASFRCYGRLFGSFGIDFDRSHFARTYSPDWYKTYSAMGLREDLWAEADLRWLRFYAEERNELIPGVRGALERLEGRGLVQGLVTSGDRQRVARELADLGVDGFFRTVVCGDDARRKKPHPEALLLGLERLGVPAAHTAYVGDSPEDVEMARADGVYSVGVPGGFPNQEALRAAGPDLLAGTLAEAAEALARLVPA